METIKFGLMLTIIPFATIFLAITIWWALVDISVKKLKGSERALWTMLVIFLPAVGSLLYSTLTKSRVVAPTA